MKYEEKKEGVIMAIRGNPSRENTKNTVYHLFNENERPHLKHPIPEPMEIKPIGKALTESEWGKFCKRYLTPKLQKDSEHKLDGEILFHGEGGFEAAYEFQNHYKDRFRLRMICASIHSAFEGLKLADAFHLNIHEVHFRNSHKEKVMLNDSGKIHEMTLEAKSHH